MADGTADLVFTGGGVYTVDAVRRRAQAVAVRDGRIVAVGFDADIHELIEPSTEVVDLRGRLLLPGFQDAHVHAPSAGLERMRIDLSGVHDLQEYRALIKRYADEHRDAEWLVGGGWAMDVFPGGTPMREVLDQIAPDRPAFINNRDNHAAWVNSRALEVAGVDAMTPDPADGRIERDGTGAPSGTLQEGAMNLVRPLVPRASLDEQLEGLMIAQRFLHSLGVTAWQDAIVGEYSTFQDPFDAYLTAAERGLLTARVRGALWFERDHGVEQLPFLIDRRDRSRVGRFEATSVKIMADGVCENFTAALLEPYLDGHGNATNNCGIPFFDERELREAAIALDARGFQVHVHAIGDRAVRTALDAFEAARAANGPNDHRHHIAHIQVVHPDDVARFGTLGVTANAQPLWAAYEPQMAELTIPFLGPQRTSWQYPFRSLLRGGATMAFGSDWPVSSPNPMWGIHVAVNREEPTGYPYGTGGGPFLAHERLDLPEAVAAATMGSAFVNHLDRDTGSIEVGKLADLVVVDRDPFEHPAGEIADARVDVTFVDGQKVFERAGS
jgi:predicted amidohydrolase YtcJ